MLWINVIAWLARLVFLLLATLSIWSISIIIERKRYYKNLTYNKKKFSQLILENNFTEINQESNDLINQMNYYNSKGKTFYCVAKSALSMAFHIFQTLTCHLTENGSS